MMVNESSDVGDDEVLLIRWWFYETSNCRSIHFIGRKSSRSSGSKFDEKTKRTLKEQILAMTWVPDSVRVDNNNRHLRSPLTSQEPEAHRPSLQYGLIIDPTGIKPGCFIYRYINKFGRFSYSSSPIW